MGLHTDSTTIIQQVDSLTHIVTNQTDTLATAILHGAQDAGAHGHALPPLIADLALMLIAGVVMTLLFRQLKQPLVLGYIIAGFLVSPHLNLTPSVVDMANVDTLAKIGVIFLLFSLGLEFSFKKLMRVGGSASITAIVEIIFITLVGYAVGKLLGWSTMNSLFLGGMLASSSTTIIIKAFDDLGIKTKNFARIVFGVLVVEDIVVILLMVLLSTIAVTQNFEGSELIFTVGRLLFFLILWFIMGIFLIPTLLKKAKHLLDDETYLILSVGLCLGMVIVATQVGFSAELGAFIMGSIFAETTSAEKIEHVIKPVKDLFGAIFFISIGMMVNPPLMLEYGWDILLVTVLVIFGKLFSTTLGAILSGQPLKQSVEVGMSMAQIGEFAFIVVTLGMGLGVIDPFLFPVAVGASVITTFTTPYMIKYADKAYWLIDRILPKSWIIAIDNYSRSAQTIQAESEWRRMIKEFTTSTISNGIITVALMIAGGKLLLPFLQSVIHNTLTANIIGFVTTLLISSPFLWALMFRHKDRQKYKELWRNKRYSRGPLLLLEIFRVLLGILLLGYLVDRIFSTTTSLIIIVPVILITLLLSSRKMQKLYNILEKRFITNFNSREIAAAKQSSPMYDLKEEFEASTACEASSNWDVHLVDLIVSQEASYVGKSLIELPWRDEYGINVVYIKRGENLFYAPDGNSRILPFDHIGIIATDEQMKAFKPVFDSKDISVGNTTDVDDIVVEKIVVDEHSQLKDIMIRNSNIRSLTEGIVVGVERDNEGILNPPATFVFEENDIVWIVGDIHKLKLLKS